MRGIDLQFGVVDYAYRYCRGVGVYEGGRYSVVVIVIEHGKKPGISSFHFIAKRLF